MKMKEPLLGKTLEELQLICQQFGFQKFVARQLTDWLYKKHVVAFDEMRNISKSVKEIFSEKYTLGISEPVQVQQSVDGTKKYLFSLPNNRLIESVMIPERDRKTLCISTQAGCKMNCAFCATGSMRFHGNLSTAEILNQMRSIPESESLTNLVYMGMGEPFDNIDAVLKSLQILSAEWGYAMSPKRITVSSIGIIPAMKRFLEESECHLAISLHSPFNEERKSLMPIQKTYPIEKVIATIRQYDLGRQRRISFEYILFKGLNCTPLHVKGLTKLLSGLRCRINLIRFHKSNVFDRESPDEQTVKEFAEQLNKKGLTTTIRASRGEDIMAACGLLSVKNGGNEETKK
ncbi:MAG: 23S rRNA (adenine(2503)-C(2))-methyltransferase RlmN [Bacteroidales bacterium]|jgi:23S rRNA (adenine2503-C2)-methyltransferase|nr:23S rRNA (adenine(2503)-C(2))-methyltransferase RlmN [Bacteroidales bacterium]